MFGFFFFKQKTAYERRISDWSSDVCSSDLLNTDAEGRLVLCDAIAWAQKSYDPKVIVDLATLTGAMVISLGHEYAGMFANDEDLAAKLLSAADASNDKLWRFPLSPASDKLLARPIAAIQKNGPRAAGS